MIWESEQLLSQENLSENEMKQTESLLNEAKTILESNEKKDHRSL